MPASVAMSGGSEPTESEPKLRHEFVGMMFAVAIGEVGLQVAALVKQSNSLHERFASYIHLLLATTIIATSWVGWTRSVAPRAKKDVTGIFQIPFLVLLVDVALVICYFVIVRSVELPTPADTLGATVRWVRNVFVLFLLWDVLTKLEVGPFHLKFVRPAIPTILCVCLAYFAVSRISPGDSASQAVVADGALLALVLLFRAGKEVIYSFWPPDPPDLDKPPVGKGFKIAMVVTSVLLFLAFFVLLHRAQSGPVPCIESYISRVTSFAAGLPTRS